MTKIKRKKPKPIQQSKCDQQIDLERKGCMILCEMTETDSEIILEDFDQHNFPMGLEDDCAYCTMRQNYLQDGAAIQFIKILDTAPDLPVVFVLRIDYYSGVGPRQQALQNSIVRMQQFLAKHEFNVRKMQQDDFLLFLLSKGEPNAHVVDFAEEVVRCISVKLKAKAELKCLWCQAPLNDQHQQQQHQQPRLQGNITVQ